MSMTETSRLSTTTPQTMPIFARLIRIVWIGPAVAALVIYIFFAIFGGATGFTSIAGTAGWLNAAAELGIIALPIGLLMIAGEFDLSTGSVVGAASIIVALGTGFYGLPIALTILMALGLGIVVGCFNAFLVNKTRLPSFIVTLASNFILAGSALALSRLISGSSNVSIRNAGWAEPLLASKYMFFNVSIVWWFLAAALVAADRSSSHPDSVGEYAARPAVECMARCRSARACTPASALEKSPAPARTRSACPGASRRYDRSCARRRPGCAR